MNRMILRFLNFPGLILLALIGIAIQTSLFTAWHLNYFQPDIVLLIVVWVALKRGFFEGGCITLLIADMAELHSAAPQGLFLLTYMVVFLLVRGLTRVLVIPTLASLVTMTLFISLFWKLLGMGVLHLLGASGNQWKHALLFLFPGALAEGIAGLWIYRWLDRYDRVTFKSSVADRSVDSTLDYDEDLQLQESESH